MNGLHRAFNAARRNAMNPENLIECTKLYDFYTNGFDDRKFDHTATFTSQRLNLHLILGKLPFRLPLSG